MRKMQDKLPNLLIYVLTLKKQAKSYLLLLRIYLQKISLRAEQQSDSTNKTEEDLIMFDIVNTFSTIVNSNIEIYTRFGQFYDSYYEDEYQKSL